MIEVVLSIWVLGALWMFVACLDGSSSARTPDGFLWAVLFSVFWPATLLVMLGMWLADQGA